MPILKPSAVSFLSARLSLATTLNPRSPSSLKHETPHCETACVGRFDALEVSQHGTIFMATYTIIGGDQKEYGSVTADDLRKWIADGRLNAQSLAKEENDTERRPL